MSELGVELKKADFDNSMNLTNGDCKARTIILFYSPMCGHCMKMKDDYKQLAKMAQAGQLGNDVTVASVNTASERDIMDFIHNGEEREFTVDGVPTIVSYQNGKYFSTYDAGDSQEEQMNFRKVGDLAEFVKGIGSAPIVYKN